MTPDSVLPHALTLLSELIALPAPPGSEAAVHRQLETYLDTLGLPHRTDSKGNLLTAPSTEIPSRPRIVVTAHMDEIALQVTGMARGIAESDKGGTLLVAPLGGVHPYKWGEIPVLVLGESDESITGILSYGSIHTTHSASAIDIHRKGGAINWDSARVHTGLSHSQLAAKGIRIGARIAIHPSERRITHFGENLIAARFLDDRADLVSWLFALESLKAQEAADILFVATACEEIGGHGILYALRHLEASPEIVVALEIGPASNDSPVVVSPYPSVWVNDGYAPCDPRDLVALQEAADSLEMPLQRQSLTRGGSDASIAAALGLAARPVTLAFPAENSHGMEICHADALQNLAEITTAYLQTVT